MVRELTATKAALVALLITVPGEITENEGVRRPVSGKLRATYTDTYTSGENKLDDRVDTTLDFDDLDAPELAAILNLIRVFEDKGKVRLGLV